MEENTVLREDVLAEAIKILEIEGIANTSLEMVAERVSCPTSDLKRFWPDREALLYDALRYLSQQVDAWRRQLLLDETLSAEQKLLARYAALTTCVSNQRYPGCLFIAAKQVGVLGAVAFRYNVLFTPSAVLLVWLLAVGKGIISRLLSAKPFLWLAGLSPYGFLIHQVLIRYMEWTADKFSFTVHPVVWTLTVYLLTLCLSSFYKALEHRVRQRLAKQ